MLLIGAGLCLGLGMIAVVLLILTGTDDPLLGPLAVFGCIGAVSGLIIIFILVAGYGIHTLLFG